MSDTNESPLLLFSWIPLPSRDSPPSTHVGNSSSPNLLLSSARAAPAALFRGKRIERDPTELRWEKGAQPRGSAGALQPRTCRSSVAAVPGERSCRFGGRALPAAPVISPAPAAPSQPCLHTSSALGPATKSRRGAPQHIPAHTPSQPTGQGSEHKEISRASESRDVLAGPAARFASSDTPQQPQQQIFLSKATELKNKH